MEEELNENELEERFYSMLHYVDDTQANVTANQNNVNILENAPRSTVRRYWRTSGDHTAPPAHFNTPFQKINIPKETPKPTDDAKPKEEKSNLPAESLPQHLSLFQSTAPQNVKQKIEILEHDDSKVVELESSDEDEVIEVALPPKPTITIDSSDEEEPVAQNTPTKSKHDKTFNIGDREISASPVPSVMSSVSDEFIRSDCIALNISSRRQDNTNLEFTVSGAEILDSTPAKRKRKRKNKGNASSTPIIEESTPEKTNVIEECFATPKSKAKKKKQKKNINKESYTVSDNSVPSADVYDSDSNQSFIDSNKNKNSYVVTEKSIPCADVYETDSNPSEIVKPVEKSKSSLNIDIDSSDCSITSKKPNEQSVIHVEKIISRKSSTTRVSETIDLTEQDNRTHEIEEINESIVIGNVTGFTESDDYGQDRSQGPAVSDGPKFGSTKVPAILYENLDFDNLKGKDKVCKSRRYSLTKLRAEMEKFYNESWGGEDFNHREIQKNMSRDKSLWAIDPKDRMPSLSRKKYNVICNYCNRPGHRDDTCRFKPPVCFMCGNVGHVEPRCPSKICVNCGAPNHMYSTMCRNCSGWWRVTCAACGQRGHPPSHCPDNWRRYHNTTDLSTHLEENRYNKKHVQLFCSGCTRRGHLVHNCRISLPFSGLPINSPYVHMYKPIYNPEMYTNEPENQLNQTYKPLNKIIQQDSTITSASITPVRNDRNKRQSKSPTVHETHINKKRNISTSDTSEKQIPKTPSIPDRQRKRSQSKEPTEEKSSTEQEKTPSTSSENTEKALDFIPIFSTNHDKKGQVIQHNEVSDTSDVVTSARIYIIDDVIDKLKTEVGQTWLKEIAEKLNVSVEDTNTNSFLNIKGKLGDQEAFQSALRDWAKNSCRTESTKSENEPDISQNSDASNDESFLIGDIPKNRNNVLRKLNKALESLKTDLGEPNEMFKELNYLQNRHEMLLKMKVINPKQLSNSRDNINTILKKLNMVLLGQAGLADGPTHLTELHTLQDKLVKYRQKTVPTDLRLQIGQHYRSIFTAFPRDDYLQLLNSFNRKQFRFAKKIKNIKINPKIKKNNSIPNKDSQKNTSPAKIMKAAVKRNNAVINNNSPKRPPVNKTLKKLIFYHRRLSMVPRPNDSVLKKTRTELVRKLYSYIASLSNNANTSSKNLKKIQKVQEQARVFLNNV